MFYDVTSTGWKLAWGGFVTLGLLLAGGTRGTAIELEQTPQPTEPQVVSMFPIGATAGRASEIEVLGRNLVGPRAIWVDDDGIQGEIVDVEPIALRLKEGKFIRTVAGHRVRLWISVDKQTALGPHALRLITHQGVTNGLIFWVNSGPVVDEAEAEHATPKKAQAVTVPVVINGRISEEQEVDYYAFEITSPQELTFEVVEGVQRSHGDYLKVPGFQLELYGREESWFDPKRVIKLGETNTAGSNLLQFKYAANIQPRLTYRFVRNGLYRIRVTGWFGASYQIQIAPPESFPTMTRRQSIDKILPSHWEERSFARRLQTDRIRSLLMRSTPTSDKTAKKTVAPPSIPEKNPSSHLWMVPISREREPNNVASQALQISTPILVEGTIEQAEDVDTFSFQAKQGEALAFELETPRKTYPSFNPRLAIFDPAGQELFTNIFTRPYSGVYYWTTAEVKTVLTFPQEGEYLLQIQAVSKRHGGPDFSYRLMIRPQIPHIGDVDVVEVISLLEREGKIQLDRVNLCPGEAKKLTVITAREEAFEGDIAIMVENLPEGIDVYPATEVESESRPPQDVEAKAMFMPAVRKSTVMLAASPEAPLTEMPNFIRFCVRPILPGRVSRYYKKTAEKEPIPIQQGVVGQRLPVLEVPLMVVAPPDEASSLSRIATENPR